MDVFTRNPRNIFTWSPAELFYSESDRDSTDRTLGTGETCYLQTLVQESNDACIAVQKYPAKQ